MSRITHLQWWKVQAAVGDAQGDPTASGQPVPALRHQLGTEGLPAVRGNCPCSGLCPPPPVTAPGTTEEPFSALYTQVLTDVGKVPSFSRKNSTSSNPSLPWQPSVRLPPVRPHLSGTGGTTTGRSTPGAASPAPSRGKGSQPSLHRGRLQPLQTHRANRSPSYLSSPPAGPLQRAESWTRPKHRFLRERRGWERVTEEPPRARRMRAARRLPRGLFPCAAIFGRVERLLRERWGWGVGNCWVSICAGGMAAAFGQGSPRARAGRGGGPFAYLGLRREVRGVTVGSRREFQVFKLEGGLHSCFVQFVGAAVGRENGLLNATAVLHCKGICYFVVFFVCLCFSLCFLPAGIYLDDSVLIPGDSSVCRKETRLSLPLWKSPSL